jgi:hypothetical protein
MQTKQLLENHPKTTLVIKEWYLGIILETIEKNYPNEDISTFVNNKDVDDSAIATILDASPRMLFDLFDNHKVYIQINVRPNFSYSINEGEVISGPWENRKDTERSAIEKAFTILEEML